MVKVVQAGKSWWSIDEFSGLGKVDQCVEAGLGIWRLASEGLVNRLHKVFTSVAGLICLSGDRTTRQKYPAVRNKGQDDGTRKKQSN